MRWVPHPSAACVGGMELTMNEPVPPVARPATPPRPLPVLTVSVILKTEFAARVYRRCFDRLKGDLYVLTVRTRAAGLTDAAKAAEEVIDKAFSAVRVDLDSEMERSDALLDDVKLTGLAQYDGVPVTKASYSTPQAREFLDLLLKMDQLLMRYDALWLAQHIDTQQRWSRCQNWQRRLTKVANRLRELGNRTRAALTRESERHSAASAEGGEAGATQSQTTLPSQDDDEALDTAGNATEEGLAEAPAAENDTAAAVTGIDPDAGAARSLATPVAGTQEVAA